MLIEISYTKNSSALGLNKCIDRILKQKKKIENPVYFVEQQNHPNSNVEKVPLVLFFKIQL